MIQCNSEEKDVLLRKLHLFWFIAFKDKTAILCNLESIYFKHLMNYS